MLKTPRQIAFALCLLALGKSLLIALIITPSYGSDGTGYLMYIDVLQDPSDPESFWDIRGTTPVYPLFAYAAYGFGVGSGYSIVLVQVCLGASVASALYLALRSINQRAAVIAGLLVALDPQTGLLYQQVATEGLYLSLLGLGVAAFIWQIQQPSLRWGWIYGLGILLGLGSLTRPVGILLIVPYVFFYILVTRSITRTGLLTAGYITVAMGLSLLNLWRFDYFAPYNTGGFYLATRLFGVGGLYDHQNGAASERLYYLAGECYLQLSDANDNQDLAISQYLRQCLFYQHDMSFDEISQLYQAVYAEATQERPNAFISSMIQQVGQYMWQTSDALDLDGAKALASDCTLDEPEWYSKSRMFCPRPPEPLAFLQAPFFIGMLGFSLLTRVVNFILAGVIFWRGSRAGHWVLLICLGLYSYHAVVTAAAGTILARYVTVTNIYTLVTLSFVLAYALEPYHKAKQLPN